MQLSDVKRNGFFGFSNGADTLFGDDDTYNEAEILELLSKSYQKIALL